MRRPARGHGGTATIGLLHLSWPPDANWAARSAHERDGGQVEAGWQRASATCLAIEASGCKWALGSRSSAPPSGCYRDSTAPTPPPPARLLLLRRTSHKLGQWEVTALVFLAVASPPAPNAKHRRPPKSQRTPPPHGSSERRGVGELDQKAGKATCEWGASRDTGVGAGNPPRGGCAPCGDGGHRESRCHCARSLRAMEPPAQGADVRGRAAVAVCSRSHAPTTRPPQEQTGNGRRVRVRPV